MINTTRNKTKIKKTASGQKTGLETSGEFNDLFLLQEGISNTLATVLLPQPPL